jgi:cytochrome P450
VSLYTSFDHYNPPIGPDQTPYDYFEALRDEAIETETPIGWSEVYGGFWVCTGWEEAREIQHDTEAFSNIDVTFPSYALPGGRPMMLSGIDEPAHKKYRRLVQAPFSPARAWSMADYFRTDTNHLIDRFIDSGRVDIVQTLTQEVPGRMTAMLLGLPPEEGGRYRTWVHAIAQQALRDPEGAAPHLREMDEHFEVILAERRANPGDDVLSLIIQSEIDGERLTDEEIKDFFVVLLVGGIDNTVYLLANMMWRLGWDKELRRRLARKPALLETAVDEFLRFYSPGIVARLITKEVTVGGVTMQPGQHVVVFHPIVNRDPRQFENPDVFNPERTPNRHFGLGLGIHRCLGAHLVRVEAQCVFEEFMRRIPEWELDPERTSSWLPGQVGGMVSVPIVFPSGGGYPDADWHASQQLAAA